jgi:class 3 adenylate cyclase
MQNGQAKTSPRVLLLNFSSIVTRLLSGVMVGVIVLFLFPLVIHYVDDAPSFGYIRAALTVEQAVTVAVKRNIPTTIKGKDLTRWIVILGAFMLSGTLSRSSDRFQRRADYLNSKLNMEQWKTEMHLSDNAILLTPLARKLEQLKTARMRDREQLLKDFAETKKKLDAMGRHLAFLSIDIVDSTGLKSGEERASVEHDFREYRRFVERILSAHGALKSAWTPDGVMSCFTSVDAAVQAAREVLNGLDRFNTQVKTLRREFAVRCGVNSGFVYFDDSRPLEELNDQVIDIAAHIQKKAKPNTACIAKQSIEPLNERSGFEPAGTMVDGYEVYEWKLV